MQEATQKQRKLRLPEFIDSVCGLYSRVARRLRLSPSYVSRVARGERESPVVQDALAEEFREVQSMSLAVDTAPATEA